MAKKNNFEEKKLARFPKSIYAMTKISNELMANLYHKEYGINFVGFRFFQFMENMVDLICHILSF